MKVISAISGKIKQFSRPASFAYPLIIIFAIPLLLTINTIWNLRSFNRDVNFVIRHQAVSIADSLKPIIISAKSDTNELNSILASIVSSNSDIISATVFEREEDTFSVLSSTLSEVEAKQSLELGVNKLAVSFGEPFAGLYYEPTISKNAWNVVIPLDDFDTPKTILNLKLTTEAVDTILKRTSRDSFIILVVLIIVTLILLANHFIFYRKAMEAKQLEEIDRLKDEFFSMAAHELRAPMTALNGYLELLRKKISPEQLPVLKEDLVTLDGITQDLHNLIDDLLNVSRIEQGRIQLSPKETQVNLVIQEVIKKLQPSAHQKGLQIEFVQDTLPGINTDPERLGQVVTNLVSNAIKYSLKGKINIKTTVKAKFIEISVSDTGIGIPPEQVQNLFTKFHRVKDSQTKAVRGTGLGLWITKQIVELLGGKIYVESIYGTGSVFTFTLPITAARV